ncbi:unnamed protein product [Polarella glacialis]|uniref:Uncharacterized protein n=1 Tax=Polarella glacialis TaxID=89957 RepID=A0A813FSL0_POLGL|nr:unnamed protein product [Polarella glacialis]
MARQFWDNEKAMKPEIMFGSMGEPQVTTNSQFFDEHPMLASSWPAALPTRRMYETPIAPIRKPSLVNWEVPGLVLPSAPKKRSLSGATPDMFDEVPGVFLLDDGGEGGGEDEGSEGEEEGMAFALDGGAGHDEEEPDGTSSFNLVGFGDVDGLGPDPWNDRPTRPAYASGAVYGSLRSAGGMRDRDGSESPILGASPTLLSALEMMKTAEAEGRRPRHGSC